jgi:hypothetical protein
VIDFTLRLHRVVRIKVSRAVVLSTMDNHSFATRDVVFVDADGNEAEITAIGDTTEIEAIVEC